MALNQHSYDITVSWTGNRGTGTSGYRDYGRDHEVTAAGRPTLAGSADPTFHGDKDRWNPEQLLLTALAQCHMLSYLHVAVNNGIVVTSYQDNASGTMVLNPDGSGQFSSVTLKPQVVIADASQQELANRLHAEAAQKCFIARSVNFPVQHQPEVTS
ncbi:OsmC family protein [Paenarthrobacter sp. Z7-10]|uniref:OsmC family protein n=1 Tax=Paenarthrobacter sp. Z7-10 TaxID=2787635 RepID=UPI0022A9CF90|nr:OsmC family protein [Paenarthrobacter sp. Z7-10]MCZ2404968.1 OsmC family protein [Paenarthrobacter sp. Z7-10]